MVSKIIEGMSLDDLEHFSQVAEAAERYTDMVIVLRALVEQALSGNKPLKQTQRNLLSVAYKNVVGNYRSSWRILNDGAQLERQEDLTEDRQKELTDGYRKEVEGQLKDTCLEVIGLLDKLAEANKKADETENETQIFYLKMIADYYRYLNEAFSTNEDYKKKCDNMYGEALKLAQEHLAPTNPTRLGLALNYSVCYYEILNQPQEACKLAKKAFDEAIEKLDSLNDESYKDSTLIMQLLRDNLTIWSQDNQADDADKGDN